MTIGLVSCAETNVGASNRASFNAANVNSTANRYKSAWQEIATVCNIRGNPAVVSLNGKIPFTHDERLSIPMSMLTLNEFAKGDERAAILAMDSINKPCRDKVIAAHENFSKDTPEIKTVVVQFFNENTKNLSLLYEQKITYATYNKWLAEYYVAFQQAMTNIYSAHHARQQSQAAVLTNMFLQSQIQSPSYTDCSVNRNQVSCRSW